MASLILHRAGGSGVGSGDCTGTRAIVLAESGTVITVDSGDVPATGSLPRSAVLAANGGTMTNRGAWTGSVGMNANTTIPAGYHNGSGYISGPSITDRGAWTGTASMNGSVTVPKGYHNGSGYVNGPSITDRGAWTGSVAMNATTTIPQGYHNGSGYISGPSVTIRSGSQGSVGVNGTTYIPEGYHNGQTYMSNSTSTYGGADVPLDATTHSWSIGAGYYLTGGISVHADVYNGSIS